MNLRQDLKVSHNEWQRWLKYLEASGYTVEVKRGQCAIDVVVKDKAGESLDCYGAMAYKDSAQRWTYYINIRVPMI